MAKRKSLSKKLRFEVFKRDLFTCQYCGRKSPDIVLNADHIKPVSKGGSDKIENLVTSCFDCNSGKSDRELSDSTAVIKSRKQLEESQLRIEQINMMGEWAESMADFSNAEWETVNKMFCSLTGGYTWSDEYCKAKVINLCKKYGLAVVLEGVAKGLEYATPEDFTMKVLNNACKMLSEPIEVSKARYCRAIYKNKFGLGYGDFKLIETCAIEMFEKYGIDKTIAMFSSESMEDLDIKMGI